MVGAVKGKVIHEIFTLYGGFGYVFLVLLLIFISVGCNLET
jgi:hypothetical protein